MELEKEKEDLKVFYDLDRDRRCLEYTMQQREQLKVGATLDEVSRIIHRMTEIFTCILHLCRWKRIDVLKWKKWTKSAVN